MKIEDIKSKLESMNVCIDHREFNHAGTVGQILMNIMLENKNIDLITIENMLREMNSRVYLLALPMRFFNEKTDSKPGKFISSLPNSDDLQDYGLWVCMNGEKEAHDTMFIHNLTRDLNLANLRKCGFLILDTSDATIN